MFLVLHCGTEAGQGCVSYGLPEKVVRTILCKLNHVLKILGNIFSLANFYKLSASNGEHNFNKILSD